MTGRGGNFAVIDDPFESGGGPFALRAGASERLLPDDFGFRAWTEILMVSLCW